ncbi:hypothetical protein BN1221_03315c [Brenneria goodwinii]|uniref:Uncharacterized protein n=1 Tax=Brenneria goodwinii TaxID=1109412 RepID=A0A0G4JY20_9GAMM|nr:hypothetical protein BN1221_03315c [Brenneria goodwinii]
MPAHDADNPASSSLSRRITPDAREKPTDKDAGDAALAVLMVG